MGSKWGQSSRITSEVNSAIERGLLHEGALAVVVLAPCEHDGQNPGVLSTPEMRGMWPGDQASYMMKLETADGRR